MRCCILPLSATVTLLSACATVVPPVESSDYDELEPPSDQPQEGKGPPQEGAACAAAATYCLPAEGEAEAWALVCPPGGGAWTLKQCRKGWLDGCVQPYLPACSEAGCGPFYYPEGTINFGLDFGGICLTEGRSTNIRKLTGNTCEELGRVSCLEFNIYYSDPDGGGSRRPELWRIECLPTGLWRADLCGNGPTGPCGDPALNLGCPPSP